MSADAITGLGTRDDHVAPSPTADARKGTLTAEERALFDKIGRASKIGDVLGKSGLPEPKAIALLLSMRAKGVIIPAKVQHVAATQSAAVLEEVDLDETRKKEILELEQKLETAHFFEILSVESGAPPEEVKKSFYELSRKFHPDRYFGKNLGSFRPRIEKIFRKMTEAQNVLTDEVKRKNYLDQNPFLKRKTGTFPAAQPGANAPSPSAPPPEPARPKTPEEERREAERRARLAHHPYLSKTTKVGDLLKRARELMAKGEYSLAFNDLNQAARIDDKNAEAKSLLAEVRRKADAQRAEQETQRGLEQMDMEPGKALGFFRTALAIDPRHPKANWMAAKILFQTNGDPKETASLAQRAVETNPKELEPRVIWAQALEIGGMKALAKRQWEEILKLSPEHPEAKKRLKGRWPF
ncbi:MAG: DnaJ domain-containing protein [Myxococcaceae bacterium]